MCGVVDEGAYWALISTMGETAYLLLERPSSFKIHVKEHNDDLFTYMAAVDKYMDGTIISVLLLCKA